MLAQLISVSKHFGSSSEPVLKDISFFVEEKDTIAIAGPSGSGKSTLLGILGTLDDPSSGEVFLDGKRITDTDKKIKSAIRNSFIGFVFQQHLLLPQLTLIENVLVPSIPVKKNKDSGKELIDRAKYLLGRTSLSSLINKYPANCSVGECQRAAVVRALINKPSLLLADEPTGSLDNDNAVKLAELLSELNREEEVAMVVVTHSPEIASFMKKEFHLHSGNLEKVR